MPPLSTQQVGGWADQRQIKAPCFPRWQRPLKGTYPFWVSFLLHTPLLPGLSDNGLWSAGRKLWSRLHFMGSASAGLSARSLLKNLKVGSPPLSYCSADAQILTQREQTDSLQFSCEKIMTNQEKDKTENRTLTGQLCSQKVQLAIRIGCQRLRVEGKTFTGWTSPNVFGQKTRMATYK